MTEKPEAELVRFLAADGRFKNVPGDAPTVYVDGIKGLMIQSTVTKVAFFEMTVDPFEGGPLGRFVTTLSIPNDQFRGIVDFLNKVLAENSDNYPKAVEVASGK